jgi:MORN repeat
MPLILTKNHPFSTVHFKSGTSFKEGKLGLKCEVEFFCSPSKFKDPLFKYIKSYVGDIIDGVFHGQGLLIYSNGDEYNGNFKFGRKHGEGVYKSMEKCEEYHSK